MHCIGAAGLEAGEAVMETRNGNEGEASLVAVVRPWGSARWAFAGPSQSHLPCVILPSLECLMLFRKKRFSFFS